MYTTNIESVKKNTKRSNRKKVISLKKDLGYFFPFLASPVSANNHTPFFRFTKPYAFTILPVKSISFEFRKKSTFEPLYFSYYNEVKQIRENMP